MQYFTYLLASESRRLLTGWTADLHATMHAHRLPDDTSIPPRHRIQKLVYIEPLPSVAQADARARQLRHWPRPAKVRFVQLHNPQWTDLASRLGIIP